MEKRAYRLHVSARNILESVSREYNRLMSEADVAFMEKRSLEAQQNKIKAGLLVAGLSDAVMQNGVDRAGLSEDQLTEIASYSNRAVEDIVCRNTFGLMVIFRDRGYKPSEPNNLEKLINEAYPQAPHINVRKLQMVK
jgi:hypothetical protein